MNEMSDTCYAISLDDPATPSYCSFPKLYFGNEKDMFLLAENLDANGNYAETAAGIRSYFAGNTSVTHWIADAEIPVLQPVDVLASSELQIGPRAWTHINIWDCPYEMRLDKATVSQLLLRYEGKYFRSIRAHFTGLCYHSFNDRWQPIGGFILGHPSVLSILPLPDGSYAFGTVLYMTEDTADSPEDLQAKMNDPDAIIFDSICEEVFGDG